MLQFLELSSTGTLLLVVLAFYTENIRCLNYRQKEREILDKVLSEMVYDRRIRPSGTNGSVNNPTIVKVNLMLRSISRIDDYKMEYSAQMTFREEWLDERLKFDDLGGECPKTRSQTVLSVRSCTTTEEECQARVTKPKSKLKPPAGQLKYLTLTEQHKVWMPDLFFSNEKMGHFHDILIPNLYIRVFPNGEVLFSIRISLTLACPMDLKLYPLDKQICSLQMASYGWTTEDLIFLWKENPVQVVDNLHLPRFILEQYNTSYCNSKTTTGEYSCLKVNLIFKREFSYYLIQIYVPCCMLVVISWLSFWLDQNAVPARVSLGVTSILTMATQNSGISSSLPPVSYTKAIDIWTGVCLTFVFSALLEFALVNYTSRWDVDAECSKKQRNTWKIEMGAPYGMTGSHLEDGSAGYSMKQLKQYEDAWDKKLRCEVRVQKEKDDSQKFWLSRIESRSKRIDVISRILFPFVFAVFNLIYWSMYLFRGNFQ